MKRALATTFALLLAAASAPAAAAASPTSGTASPPPGRTFTILSVGHDWLVQSGFRHRDGCLLTEASVIAWEYSIESQDRNVDDAEAQIFLTVTDTCERGEVVFRGFGMAQESTDAMDLNISPTLNTARLVADIPFREDSDAPSLARVDITYQATGDPLQRSSLREDEKRGSCKQRLRQSNVEATATAAGTLVIAATEYTPESAEWAWIAEIRAVRTESCY